MSAGFSELSQRLFPDFVRYASPEAARFLMLAAGTLYFSANAKERKLIEESVCDLLGPGEDTKRVQRRVLEGITEHYFEKLFIANHPLSAVRAFLRERVSLMGLESLDEALAAGRGAIAVTAHWGAVEFIPPVLVDRGYPLTVVLETKTPRLRRALERLVAGADVELLIASRGDQVLAGIFDALRRGRVLLTEVDEVDAWRRRKSKTIKLFGKTLFFDHSLDFIAKRSLAPAVGIFCARSGGLRYELRCEALAPDPLAADVAVKALERWEMLTMSGPEQWYQWKKWGLMKAPTDA
jgi:Kdo2-lipid IVA lauroyltransferase/acyltransferase